MPIRLSIIVVNWNGGNAVVANVRSLAGRARTRGDTEIIVVDNASTDRSREELSALADDAVVRVLPQPGNRGFGPACNVGASDARSSLLLFLNPDVRPRVSEDPLGALIDAADAQAEYAGFCPLLLDDDTGAMARQQRFQFRHLWTPSAIVRDALLVNQLRPNNRALQRDRYLTVDRSRPFEVQQPAAAALMLRRTVFEAVGGFDERYLPAWWEDADLAERLHRGGHRLITVPDARFVHQGGSSLEGERRITPFEFGRTYTRNQLQYVRRWWGPAVTFGLRLVIAAGSLIRLVLLAVGAQGDRPRREAAAVAGGSLVSACVPAGRPLFPGDRRP